jgi:hypothetical protein
VTAPRRRATSLTALALSVALPLAMTTGAGLPVARAADAADRVPAAVSAAWLAALLTDGERMVSRDFDLDDVDLTLDVLLGLAAARSAGIEQRRILAWFSDGVADHVGTAAEATYVATAAKGALAAMAVGADPRAVGGVDLIALLAGRVGASGRLTDRGTLGDLSSSASQALAVLALHRAGADPTVTARAATFLAGTACADGGFAAELDADDCSASIVPTALALQALAAAGGQDEVLATGTATLLALLDTGVRDPDVPEGWQLGLAAQALRALAEPDAAQQLTELLLDRLDGCEGQASGALLDEQDPIRATIGALLAASGTTLSTLGDDASTAGTGLLDCALTAAETAPVPTEPSGDGDPDVVPDGGAGPTPIALGLTLLVLLAVAGVPVLRRLRAERDGG